MTDTERIDDLEIRLKLFEDFFKFGRADDGCTTYAMTMGRLGIMTEFWAKKPHGQGAALSIGTEIDRFACYAEIDGVSCPDHPSTAFYGSVVASNPNQLNLAFEAHAANAPHGNVPYYGDYQYAPNTAPPTEGIRLVESSSDGSIQKQVSISANGITLKAGIQSISSYFVGLLNNMYKNIWP